MNNLVIYPVHKSFMAILDYIIHPLLTPYKQKRKIKKYAHIFLTVKLNIWKIIT
jgi:hypothetical protein